MDLIQYLVVLLVLCLTCIHFLRSNSSKGKSGKLPPGPFRYPIIGNIPQLSLLPHQSLAQLAKIHGPIMYLKLGSIDTVVVSSPEFAKEVLQHQALLGRRIPAAAEVHEHDTHSMAWLPVANRWRTLRKISKEQMFSVPRLEANQGLRQEKLQKLSDYIEECSANRQLVDVGEAAFITTLNLMSATIFSLDYGQFDSHSTQELKETILAMTEVVASFNLVDFFPIFKKIDPQRVMEKSKSYYGQVYAILQGMIDERLKLRSSLDYVEKTDFLEALLNYSQSNPSEFPREYIKHLLLDLFVAGADTTASTAEWVVAYLIRCPNIMSKVRNELWNIVGRNNKIKESDISKLPYLQSVIKETFRLHPTGPLLIPHKAEIDTEINGYMIPKDAQILVNIWAIGRDPRIWPNPDSFDPERFLKREIDIRGQDFDLIPFGSGKRMCPGFPLATRMLPLLVATIIHSFDWKPETGKPEEIDTSEKFGVTLQKKVHLKAFPVKV